ncbi:ubiquinone biosynthesis hydrox [Gloeophyllum trabeum ATCC 11539]|uniref:Ubiquinone biosynthesis monooxygenase COQ6, mitochondrial n=1 Tax=Gloeophyllum trabeum (strain ATCC 11539 / FP-39264 / Madison 617) TaxID=670483 RepID=S7QBA5_GLOTA|nr:ubiquinone biosynthesis hydrox [Gloeophyllum trabeum ATCC 11539]EPQ56623.1 ubiquinone biosynthesis hydrox [Gloeophyllum trabeum ATCC 11539]
MLSCSSRAAPKGFRPYNKLLVARADRARLHTDSRPEDYDVVIVGGGPAGLALASALGSKPHVRQTTKVALIEAGDLAKIREWHLPAGSFSNRVSSLTNASQYFLESIGAWRYVDETRTAPMEEMQVWDGISDARITYVASELGFRHPTQDGSSVPQMARMTENLNLQRALLRHLSSVSEVQLLDKTKVSSIIREDREGGGWPLVHLSDGRVLRARLLIGADGFNSPVRSYAGISSYGWAYPTQAIVATLSHQPRSPLQGPNTTAYQRFLPTGPIAFLPLSPTESSLVWSTRPHLAQILTKSNPDVLTSMINAAFRLPEVSIRHLHKLISDTTAHITPNQIQEEIAWRERSHAIPPNSALSSSLANVDNTGLPPEDAEMYPPLVKSIQPGTVASFPLRFNHADTYIGEGAGSRTVLVGDAAHTIHPLAGQGLNMGLMDVESLAECIGNAVLTGGDIGSYTALMPYAQDRYFENHKILSAVDKLHKLYSSTLEPVVWARSVGLEVVNELDSVKAAIMMSAGAEPRVTIGSAARIWGAAAKGVESLAGAMGLAVTIGQGAAGAVHNGLQELMRATTGQRRV